MTDTVQEKKSPSPPDWLFKGLVNPMMKTILRSPIHGMMSGGLAVITYTGVKSGKKYSTPVAYHVKDEQTIYTFTRSRWHKNLFGGKPVTLRIKGKDYPAMADVITDNEQTWALMNEFMDKYDGNIRRVGIMLGKDATSEEIRAAAADLRTVVFTLE
jgi:hypothetical protein